MNYTLLILGFLFAINSAFAGEQCFSVKLQRSDLALLMGTLNTMKAEYKVRAPETRFDGRVDSNGKLVSEKNLDDSGKAIIVYVDIRVWDLLQDQASKKAMELMKILTENELTARVFEGSVSGTYVGGKISCKDYGKH